MSILHPLNHCIPLHDDEYCINAVTLLDWAATMLLSRLSTLTDHPVDGASGAAFRIVFGLLGLTTVVRFFVNGWIDRLYIDPSHHFGYLGLEWLQPWPGWGMYVHFTALGVLSLGIALGYRYRLCAALFCLGFTWVELFDRSTYLNHYYWMSLVSLLMTVIPLHRVASVDAWRNPSPPSGVVPRWAVWALRAQVGIVYVFAGIAKLNPDWLFHALPMRIWLYQQGHLPMVGPLLQEAWTAYAMSWGGAFFDLTIVAWLLWRRSRPWAYACLAGFHVVTWLLFPQLGIFPMLMIGGALIFFAPDWPRRLLAGRFQRLALHAPDHGKSARDVPAESEASRRPGRWLAGAGVAALVLFAAAQLAVPLRHYAYPGNVRWNEEGYRFAWRMMLTEKVGFVQYHVRHPETGLSRLVSPDEYLTPLQTERIAFQPDMILQTAHIIAADFAEQGYHDVAVTADAFVSFNGRPNARLIDPAVNLAAIKPSLAPKSWTLAFPPDGAKGRPGS